MDPWNFVLEHRPVFKLIVDDADEVENEVVQQNIFVKEMSVVDMELPWNLHPLEMESSGG